MGKDEFNRITENVVDELPNYRPVFRSWKESINSLQIVVEEGYTLQGVRDVLETVIRKGYTYKIVEVKCRKGMNVRVIIEHEETVEDLVIEALGVDGGHHKQWYLNQIAEKLDLSHPPDRFEQGIPP